MPKLLSEANGIIVEFGVRRVLDIDRIRIYDGERVGLIGENGAGKTTLLDVLSGTRTPDSGVVSRYGELAMICQLGNGESAENAEIRARFSAQDVREGLSGGEMTRRRIAAALSKRAPLLLADEPTTDLDAEGVQELTAELSHYEGAIVLVSHDRGLLDALCTRILHLEDGKITDFPGNYTEYRAELERRRAFQQFEYDQYRGEQARLRASIQDNRERSSQRRKPSERWGNSEARLHKMDGRQNSEKYHKARRQMESRLNHMEVKTRPREDIAITMALGASNPVSAKTILEARYLSLRAGDKPLLKNASFRLPTGSRTALVGANGCGKTTLMRAIAAKAAEEGKLENQNAILGESPDCAIRFNPAARVGWFDQTHERTLNPEWSALENILSETEAPESDVRTVLARLGIRGDDVFKPARVLSGGERGRVALAKLLDGQREPASARRADESPRRIHARSAAAAAFDLSGNDSVRQPRFRVPRCRCDAHDRIRLREACRLRRRRGGKECARKCRSVARSDRNRNFRSANANGSGRRANECAEKRRFTRKAERRIPRARRNTAKTQKFTDLTFKDGKKRGNLI